MQLLTVLHKFFEKKLPSIHKLRLNSLLLASSALIHCNKLTLTAIGRNLSNKANTRSNIKKMDRLLSNQNLQKEISKFYKLMGARLITKNSHPWIHIDWSCICALTQQYVLRASISMSGRSVVIYEEAHPKSNENNHPTHKKFLDNLKNILPDSAKPIIVTDAGFRAPWFKYILFINWDFVGRIRNKNVVKFKSDLNWMLTSSLYPEAKATPKFLGKAILTKKEQVCANFVIYKKKSKGRHRLTHKQSKSCSGSSKRYAKGHSEPWLLVTSLETSKHIAKNVVNIYRQRMRIEENFRDTKCTRYGFGLKESRTRSHKRMKILLLIAAIATFACWLAGIMTKQKGKASTYQAQSSKYTSVLSNVYLGREVLKRGLCIKFKQLERALSLFSDMHAQTQLEAPQHG